MSGRRYPVSCPSLTELERKYLLDAYQSGWISSRGAYLDRFETQFALRVGSRTAHAVANGTVALHLALAAAGVGPGDEVIVPALTYVATANAVTYCGADPVFVDVRPETWCIDVDRVAAALSPRTRAVIAVDLYGHPADYPALRELCRPRGILLVADAAESFGARLGEAEAGALADVTTFSFFGNKVLTCGEGGCLTTSDDELADAIRMLRNHGRQPEQHYFFPVVGYNYRLTNIAAAILCAQLERSDSMLASRDAVIATYERHLADVAELHPQPVVADARRAPWMASFLVGPPGDDTTRDRLADRLDRLGVETRPFFVALPDLPPYRRAGEAFPVARDLSRRGINLPTYDGLTDADLAEIVSRVRVAVGAVAPRGR
jgi:perosamine synthetase